MLAGDDVAVGTWVVMWEGGLSSSSGDVAVMVVALRVEWGSDVVVVGRWQSMAVNEGGLWVVTWWSWVVSVSTSSPPGWPKMGVSWGARQQQWWLHILVVVVVDGGGSEERWDGHNV